MTSGCLREHEASIQEALREYFKSNQREREQSEFVIPSEPKILRLVIYDLVSKVIICNFRTEKQAAADNGG